MQRAASGNGLFPDLEKLTAISPSDRTIVRFLFVGLVGLAAFSLPRLFETGKLSGRFVGSYSLQWLILLAIVSMIAVVELVGLGLVWSKTYAKLAMTTDQARESLARFGFLNLVGAALPWIAFVLLILYRYEKHFASFLPRVWLFWLAALVGAFFMMAYWRRLPFFWALLAVAILYGAGVKFIGYLPEISSFPFSLSWSEASRYYYASLPYATRMYGFSIPLTPMHPSRYLIMGVPFWLAETPLWLHRFWQVFLWVFMSLAAGWALMRRFRLPALVTLAAALWASLYVLQGPVYYHLQVSVILVLWTFDRQRFWKTTVFVVLASLWAGISRVNWIPVPAFLAVTLYLLEQPVRASGGCSSIETWGRYLAAPLVWGLAGIAAALASQAAYVWVSGHDDVSAFGSSFTSALLWYRLLPSPTYPMGVLPMILLVTAPVLFLIGSNWTLSRRDWHFLRMLGVGGMLFILFTGGLVVSTKIGGGSNIHNLDSFIILVLVVGSYVFFGRVASETEARNQKAWKPWGLLFIILALPVVWNIDIGDPFIKRNMNQANYDLGKIQTITGEYAAQGEVLFITQRQLAVFGLVPGVRMAPDYELLTLSEMAISNNRVYLEQFYADLRRHRFALIVADRQSATIKDPAVDSFAEENNAWVTNIGNYLMKYYKSKEFLDTQGIDLLIPRE